jgi:CBS-domain-containing membrane protein
MEVFTVEDLMVPIEDYGVVDEDATLLQAVLELEKAQERRKDHHIHLHRGVLVQDQNKEIIGRIGLTDVMRGLEPRYKDLGDVRTLSRAGFSPDFLKSMLENFSFCDSSLTEYCSKGSAVKVRDIMYTPAEGEFVDAEATICEAIHQFVLGHHVGLLVTKDKKIVGVLRQSDVFHKVADIMMQCEL